MLLKLFRYTKKKVYVNISLKNFATITNTELFKNDGLTQDQTNLKELAHGFFTKELPPNICSEIDRNDNYPKLRELWKKMGSLGLHGITSNKEYGGLELGYFEHCLAMEAMSQYHAGLALSYGAHSNLCINQLTLNGNKEQKERYLPKLIDGSFIGALAMSEVGSGSDVTSMRTTGENKGDYYVLNGSKFWITNGPVADLVIVYAKTSPKGITAFLVETSCEGFSVTKKLSKMGMRGSPTGELVFDNCKVPAANILGQLDHGVYVLMSGLDFERLVLASGPMGIMQRSCDIAFQYAHERKQFGQEIGKFQLLQAKMADMFTETIFCRAALYSIAQEVDKSRQSSTNTTSRISEKTTSVTNLKKGSTVFSARCASVILKCAESATNLAGDAIQILGGNGYTEDYEASRLFRDAKLYEIGAGTSEIRRWLIGREINKAYSSSSS